ncbi:MAG: xanthine dehydrogenase small subunit [Beijerinckiaceae bacterium]
MDNARAALQFVFRGAVVRLTQFPQAQTLLDWLRRERHAHGVKEGCAEGDCGACTVVLRRIVDGQIIVQPVNACILLLGQVDGAEILTIEDMMVADQLHPVQQMLIDHHGSQCGFCTPGIAMSLLALHETAPRPLTRAAVLESLAGNLCRCTGYRPIIDAALAAGAMPVPAAMVAQRQRSDALIRSLADGRALFSGTEDAFFAAPLDESQLSALLQRHPDATLIGGATDFGLRLTKALIEPGKIIWLGRIGSLAKIKSTHAGLDIGGATPLAHVADALGVLHPDLSEIMQRFGSMQVRASGTAGGNIANGSPVGDLAPLLMALGADIELRRGHHTRRIPLETFFLGYKKQDRAADEYLARIIVPALQAHEQYRAFKVSKRRDEDISTVCLAVKFSLAGRSIVSARLACGAMAAIPARAPATEAALCGLSLDDAPGWDAAIEALAIDFSPLSDQRASASYRMTTAQNLLRKALIELAQPASATRLHDLRAAE